MVNGVASIPFPGPREPGVSGCRTPRLPSPEFVVGAENQLLLWAVNACLEASASGLCGPLVLYGPTGAGKSHLALGLADAWRQKRPGDRVVVTTGAQFAKNLHRARERRAVPALRAEYGSVQLLVIDDLEGLSSKPAADRELVLIIDLIAEAAGHVVVTSHVSPSHMTQLSPRLRSRLVAGLASPVRPPGAEARQALLQRMADERGLAVPREVAAALAVSAAATVPDLYRAILRLEQISGQEREDSGDFASASNGEAPLGIRAVAAASAKHFGLKPGDLRSPSRRRGVVVARGMAIYLTRQLTSLSLEKIGAYFGGRDHTTILHGYRKTADLIQGDPAMRTALAQIRRTLVDR